MVLVDTSVWIQFINGKGIEFTDLKSVVTCPPVIQEVLQGMRQGRPHQLMKLGLNAMPILDSNVPLERYIEASEIYRLGRKKGKTIRSSTDCLIAAIAIAHKTPLVHFDKDFTEIAKFTSLEIAKI